MTALFVILWLLALVSWLLAAIGAAVPRVNLVALGLLFAGLTFFLPLIGVG